MTVVEDQAENIRMLHDSASEVAPPGGTLGASAGFASSTPVKDCSIQLTAL
jgi:hypothetical protein